MNDDSEEIEVEEKIGKRARPSSEIRPTKKYNPSPVRFYPELDAVKTYLLFTGFWRVVVLVFTSIY